MINGNMLIDLVNALKDIDRRLKTLEASEGNNHSLRDSTGNLGVYVADGGDVGIGHSSPVYPFHLQIAADLADGILARYRGHREGANLAAQYYHDGTASTANKMSLALILNTSTQDRTAANIAASFNDTTDGSRTSLVEINTAANGTFGPAITILGNDVGIQDVSPSYALDVTGDINATGEVRNSGVALTSDPRLKRNMTPIAGALAKLAQVRGYEFEWGEKAKAIHPRLRSGTQHGLDADEIERAFPDLVSEWQVKTGEQVIGTDEDGNNIVVPVKETIKCVDYARVVPLLLEAIRELQQQVAALQAAVRPLPPQPDPPGA